MSVKEIAIGDIGEFIIDGIIKKSKIFKIEGGFAFVDYFEGPQYIHRKNAAVTLDHVNIIAKAIQSTFTKRQTIKILQSAFD